MILIVTQDRDQVCQIWKGDVDLFKNKLGMFIPKRTGKLLGRVSNKFCKKLFGCVPRPRTAVRIKIEKLDVPVEIRKQKKVNKVGFNGQRMRSGANCKTFIKSTYFLIRSQLGRSLTS